jgi:translin
MEGTMKSGSPSSGNAAEPAAPLPESVAATIEAHLRQREARREELFERARRLRRLSQSTMLRLHDGHPATEELAEIRRLARELADWTRAEGRGDESIAHDAFQEAVEATLLGAVFRGEPLPAPTDLAVDPELYLLGLGDLVGEVRRIVLARLNAGDLAGADRNLSLMDGLYRTLLRFDTTRAIVALKPKQDTARALLERTRGEVTMAHLLARAHLTPPVEGP